MTTYEQGFIEKCAEFGIDGKELLKAAQASVVGGGADAAGPLAGAAGGAQPTIDFGKLLKMLGSNALGHLGMGAIGAGAGALAGDEGSRGRSALFGGMIAPGAAVLARLLASKLGAGAIPQLLSGLGGAAAGGAGGGFAASKTAANLLNQLGESRKRNVKADALSPQQASKLK